MTEWDPCYDSVLAIGEQGWSFNSVNQPNGCWKGPQQNYSFNRTQRREIRACLELLGAVVHCWGSCTLGKVSRWNRSTTHSCMSWGRRCIIVIIQGFISYVSLMFVSTRYCNDPWFFNGIFKLYPVCECLCIYTLLPRKHHEMWVLLRILKPSHVACSTIFRDQTAAHDIIAGFMLDFVLFAVYLVDTAHACVAQITSLRWRDMFCSNFQTCAHWTCNTEISLKHGLVGSPVEQCDSGNPLLENSNVKICFFLTEL